MLTIEQFEYVLLGVIFASGVQVMSEHPDVRLVSSFVEPCREICGYLAAMERNDVVEGWDPKW